MRVTNAMLTSKYLNNLNRNMAKQDLLLNRMANNRKVSHFNEDPISFIYSQAARQKLDRLEGYQAMVKTAQDWTADVEAGTMELNKVLVAAYEECINISTDVKSGGDRRIISESIGQLRDQLLQALNTTFGEKFVFGGYNTVGYTQDGKIIPPFTVDETTGNLMFNNADLMDPANWGTPGPPPTEGVLDRLRKDVISLDVGPGISMPITINGIDLVMIPEVKIPILDEFGNQTTDAAGDPAFKTVNNMYNLLDELYQMAKACETINTATVDPVTGETITTLEQRGAMAKVLSETFITPLQNAQRQTLARVAEIGGRSNRLEMLESRYADDEIAYTQMQSDAEDADQAELIMNYKMAESIYKAALATGSYVIKPTLMDFLR